MESVITRLRSEEDIKMRTSLISLFVLINFHFVIGSEDSLNLILQNGKIVPARENNLRCIPCLAEIFKKYFNINPIQYGSIILIDLEKNMPKWQEKVFNEIFTIKDFSWTILIRGGDDDDEGNSNEDYDLPEQIRNYFAFIKSSEDIEDVIDDWKSIPKWNPLAQMLFFYSPEEENSEESAESAESEEADDEDEDTLTEILTAFINLKILNVNLITISSEENNLQVIGLYPYDDGNCGDKVTRNVIMDTCEFVENSSEVILKEKIPSEVILSSRIPSDFHQCPLKVSARTWEPYTFSNEKKEFVAGIDVMLVWTIGKKLNLSVEISPQKKSMYHLYQNLIENTIDIIIGGVDQDPSISDLISSTIPYYQDDMTWCVQRAGRLLEWSSFLTLFDPLTWSLISLAVQTTSIFIFYIRNKSSEFIDYSITLIGIIAVIIGQSPNIFSFRFTIRFLLFYVFCFAIVINTAYQSFLISFLTHPKMEEQINTAQQIFKHQMDVTGGIEVVGHLNREGAVFEYLKKKIMICHNVEKCLQEVATKKTLGIAISREYAFYNPKIPRERLFCFDQTETIYSYLVSLLVPKKFHLLEKFDDILYRIIESGHIVKWTTDLKTDLDVKMAMKQKDDDSDITLTLAQIQGPFILAGFLAAGAICVLLFEIIVFRMHKRRPDSKFWGILNRYFFSRKSK